MFYSNCAFAVVVCCHYFFMHHYHICFLFSPSSYLSSVFLFLLHLAFLLFFGIVFAFFSWKIHTLFVSFYYSATCFMFIFLNPFLIFPFCYYSFYSYSSIFSSRYCYISLIHMFLCTFSHTFKSAFFFFHIWVYSLLDYLNGGWDDRQILNDYYLFIVLMLNVS